MSRFGEEQDPLFRRINSSISFDWRLASFDIEQSKAHARARATCRSYAPTSAKEFAPALRSRVFNRVAVIGCANRVQDPAAPVE